MRERLPDTLGKPFWFSLFMVGLCGTLALWGYFEGAGTKVAVSVALGAVELYNLIDRYRQVRLARALKKHPDIERIYYDRDH